MNISDERKNVKLTVICLTYNHAKFIRQALDGFVMQETDFPFEVIIHDDASIDSTADIIREYEKKYPDIIKPIYQMENQWSKGGLISKNYIYPKIRGEYVALCEGDDYWTDPLKLQKQVDFLEKNREYSICFHPVEVKWEDKSQSDELFPRNDLLKELGDMSLNSLLRCNFIQTNSAVYRWRFHRDSLDLIPDKILPGDWFLHLLHAQIGKIGFLSDVMGVYRKHQAGVWWNAGKSDLFYIQNGLPHLNFFYKVRTQFGYFNQENIFAFAQNTLFAFLKCKKFDKIQQFSEQFADLYDDTVFKLTTLAEMENKIKQKKQRKQNKWRKLCGRIVKHHKITYYFLYIPIVRIKRYG